MLQLIQTIAFIVASIKAAAPHPHHAWVRLFGGQEAADRDARLAAAREQDRAGFVRGDTYLCAEQRAQGREGFVAVELVQSIYGYTVRYASGLQGRSILRNASGRGRIADSPKADELYAESLVEAAKWAIEWAKQDPTRREVLCYKKDIEKYGLLG